MATKDTGDVGASRLLGRYELLVPAISGALGELWHARIASGPEDGRIVDIRRIFRSVGLEKRDVERLTNAGFAAMELRHPRIAAVLDVVVGATEIAIVSEHVGGAVLQAIVNPKPGKRVSVPPAVACRVALDLLEAIDVLREPWAEIFPSGSPEDAFMRASLHGGLLPDGLVVASFGEAMLLEAGLAGVAATIAPIFDQPDVIAYRAPEQLEPGRAIDERADVFTVGVLLWEMIAGRSLFGPTMSPRAPAAPASPSKQADPVAVSGARRRVLSHPIARLDALPLSKGKVPKPLASFIACCLERDAARRFPNLREAIRSLSAIDRETVASHDAVAAFVKTLGISEPVVPDTEPSPMPSSSRPTVPPLEDAHAPADTAFHEGKTRPGTVPRRMLTEEPDTEKSPDGATGDFGETAQAHAAQMLEIPDSIPPSTDVESLPPSDPAPQRDVVVSSSVDIVSAPQGDAVTLRPLIGMDVSIARDGVAPAAEEGERAGNTAAPVVRPLSESASTPPASDGTHVAALSTRRDRSKKIVFAVLAAAVVLVILAVLRAAFSDSPHGAPGAGAAGPTTQAVGAEALRPAVETSPAAPSVEAPAQASAGAPTSVPAVASAVPAETGARKSGWSKKRAYRPSGI